MRRQGLLLWFYCVSLFLLFLYSYTQVDLSLTLSRASIFQTIERGFQYIGYFQRPLSTNIFLIILSLLSIGYIVSIVQTIKGKLNEQLFWKIFLFASVILTFSYVAFSYDIFNNIFDAKIITYYHQNPYMHSALDFPQDPMLSFMHWVQRTYPYGPGWLALAVPLSFLGFQFFLPTFFLFKILISLCLIGTVYFIGKIAQKITPSQKVLSLVLFGLNPLIIIEFLVSSHNDIAMMFFAVLGTYLLFQKKWVWALLLIIFSALIKQVTVFLLPMTLIYIGSLILRKKTLSPKMFLYGSIISMAIGTWYVLTQREIQPWYFVWTLPFVVLLRKNEIVISLIVGLSVGLLLRYVPFLYLGNWDGVAIPIRFWVTMISPIIFVLLTICWNSVRKLYHK